ncbi:tetratricopeptide repeat protein, partial [Bacillus cereus]|nr:tetratricopeptide repeat protein [Bacillus cereus]
MNVHIQGNEQITHLLNEWYQEIRARHVDAAQLLKQEIENKIHNIEENQTILLYYSLLD